MKTVTNIEVPTDFIANDDYSSHKPLIYAILKNDRECHRFAEFGSGNSTDVFSRYCNVTNRKFESYENDIEWSSKTEATPVKDYKNVNLLMGYILFIDSKPGEQRKELIELNRHKYILIVHDTEEYAQKIYGIEDILNTFKYRVDFKPHGLPATTALSNIVNIEEWV